MQPITTLGIMDVLTAADGWKKRKSVGFTGVNLMITSIKEYKKAKRYGKDGVRGAFGAKYIWTKYGWNAMTSLN